MTVNSLLLLNFIQKFHGIGTDLIHKFCFIQRTSRNLRQFHFPLGSKFRFFKISRHQLQKLFCLGSDIDIISLLFQKKTAEQFFYDICPGCHRAKTAGLAQGFHHLPVFIFHIVHRIFHGGQKTGLCKSGGR